MRTLLVDGANPNARRPADDDDAPLHIAGVWGRSDGIPRLLLKWGVNPALGSRDGMTPAEMAGIRRRQEPCALLAAWSRSSPGLRR